jgi:hypothetical protein
VRFANSRARQDEKLASESLVTARGQSDRSFFAICESLVPKPYQKPPKQHQIVLGPSSFSQQRHLFLNGKSLNCLGESIGDAATARALYQTRLSIITGDLGAGGICPAAQGDWGLADDDGQSGWRAE